METALTDILLQRDLIRPSEKENIQRGRPLSVYWDLRFILYLGVILATTAVGILIYKNINTIGHNVLLAIIIFLTLACFVYCFRRCNGYEHTKANSAGIWADYTLLAGCLLLLTLAGYLQFQYQLFGNRWGVALFIPMGLLFVAAYYFDHLGVLSLAITNLAAWAGIAITPTVILRQNDFNEVRVMFAGLFLGIALVALAEVSIYKKIKAHFAFTYRNFGIHLLFISMLAILFYFDTYYLFCFLALSAIAFFLFRSAIKENSFYFLVVTLLYFYIGLSCVIIRLFLIDSTNSSLYGIVLYFIFSGIGLMALFKSFQKKLSTK